MKKKTKIEEMREKTRLKKRNLEKIEKSKLGLNQLLKPLLFFVISFGLEIASFILFDFRTSSGSKQILPQYILFDVGIWLIVCALILCTHKNWLSNLIFYVSLFVESIIFVTNLTLKGDFGYLFTFDMLDLIPEMVESMDVSFINIKLIVIGILAAAVVIAIPIVFDKLLKNKKIELKHCSRSIFCLLFFLITATVGAGCYAAQTALIKTSDAYKEISDDKYLYKNQQIADLSYQKFGSCGFYLKTISNLLFPSSLTSSSETDEIIKEYDSSVESTNKTASFYGDNLIVIMLESFEWFAIDPYNTPNLYALKTGEASSNISKQATIFTNYNSNNKTNVSENLCMLGYMPSKNTYNVKSKNVYATKYSLPNLLKNEGYTTSFFHNWKINFYNREETNTNIGFDNIYSLKDFENENKSTKFNYYNLEADFIEQFMDKIAPTSGEKFMSFYTTVSSHGSYKVTNPQFSEYYKTYDNNLEQMKEYFKAEGYHYPESEDMQAILREYKAAAMDADAMVGKLFAHLNTTGLISNTTVVLYADHNAFYHELTNEIKQTRITDYDSTTAYTVPLMIYTNGRAGTNEISNFCSPYDLYPTICSMMGLPYNTINAQGKDIFSESKISETVYMSHLTGFYSEKCYSKNMQYITRYDGATDADVEAFKTRVCKLLEKQRKLNIIYKSNRTY